MNLIIKIITVVIISIISAYFVNRIERKSLVKTIVLMVITAVAVLLTDETVNWVDRLLNTPKLTITTQKSDSEINIDIQVKRTITEFSIRYPIEGIITNIQDNNSINKGYTTMIRTIGGDSPDNLINNLEFSVINLRPNAHVQYKIFYKPNPKDIFIGSSDKYEYSFIWEYNGNKYYKNGWKLKENDTETTAGDYIHEIRFYNRNISQQESNKIYEEGPTKKTFNYSSSYYSSKGLNSDEEKKEAHAETLNNVGDRYRNEKNFVKAIDYYGQSLKIYRELETINSERYLVDVSNTLDKLAVSQMAIGNFATAIENGEEVLAIKKTISNNRPDFSPYEVIRSLGNLSLTYFAANDTLASLRSYNEALKGCKKLYENHPSDYYYKYARLLLMGGVIKKENELNKKLAIEILNKYPKDEKSLKLLNDAKEWGVL